MEVVHSSTICCSLYFFVRNFSVFRFYKLKHIELSVYSYIMRMFQVFNMFSFQKLRHNELFIQSLHEMFLFSEKYTLGQFVLTKLSKTMSVFLSV